MAAPSAAQPQQNFGPQLKRWRKQRRCTQLELAFISGYSQRHLSFLESGRSQPSRDTVAALADALDVPVGRRNELYLAAGFAPPYTQQAMDSQALQPTMAAMQALLRIHKPFPAMLVDQHWNLYAANPNALALFAHFTQDPDAFADVEQLNTLRASLHPQGMRPYTVNWREFVARLLGNLRREVHGRGHDPDGQALISEIELALSSDNEANPVVPMHSSPITHLILERDGVRLELAALMSYFDSPFDATIAGLRIETFVPATEPTREFLETLDRSLPD